MQISVVNRLWREEHGCSKEKETEGKSDQIGKSLTVTHVENALYFSSEVRVTGGINDVDLDALYPTCNHYLCKRAKKINPKWKQEIGVTYSQQPSKKISKFLFSSPKCHSLAVASLEATSQTDTHFFPPWTAAWIKSRNPSLFTLHRSTKSDRIKPQNWVPCIGQQCSLRE